MAGSSPYRPFYLKFIVIPLTVMLLLTLILGATSFQLTRNWESASSEVTGTLIRSQLLHNIRWQLRQADWLMARGQEEEARRLWNEVRKQVTIMEQSPRQLYPPPSLSRFVTDPENITRTNAILGADYFNTNLTRLPELLDAQQENARQVTLTITGLMAFLGLLLTVVTAIDLNRMFRRLVESRDLISRIQEEERRRIAQDLHDGVIQELVDLKRDYQPGKVDPLIEQIRRVCHNLKPQILEDLGLAAALDMLADDLRQQGLRVRVQVEEENALRQLPQGYELALFRIAQELMNNIRRHAKATDVRLTLVYDPAESPMLRLYLQDNGQGFDPDSAPKGLGLTGVRQRVNQLGGTLRIQPGPENTGTLFQILLPVTQEASPW